MAEQLKAFESSAFTGAHSAVRREQTLLRAALAEYSAGKKPTAATDRKVQPAKKPRSARSG